MDRPIVYDQQGQQQDWEWLAANFGAISVERAEIPAGTRQVYRIVKLQDSEGPAVQIVIVRAQDGSPIEGINIVRHWPDAPGLPAWPAPASLWHDQGVYGATNMNGEIGFGMGRGDYYFAPSGGASAVWVADQAGPSDLISGLGMLGATNHRHLDVHYQLEPVEVPPAPPPPGPLPEPPQPEPSPEPPPPEPSPPALVILGMDGQPQDSEWLERFFGTVEHHVAPEPDAYRLVELREVVGIQECKITILDEQGNPQVGVPVAFRHRHGLGGHVAETDANGVARFPLEKGTKYSVPGQGPYLVRVKQAGGPSDSVIGLGRVRGTPRHLDATFRLVPGELPAPPEPQPPQPAHGFEILDEHGQPQDLAWLERYFGIVEHHKAPDSGAFQLARLCEVVDNDECKVTILDQDGNPAAGVPVTFRRRDGTGGRSTDSDADGSACFPLEDDATYAVPGQGPYLTMVKKAAGPSDAVIGLGRVRNTPRHLDITLRLAPGGAKPAPPPEPTPEPPDPVPEEEPEPPISSEERWQQVLGKLEDIITVLEKRVG